MSDFKLHDEATALADGHSAYELAKMVIELEAERERRDLIKQAEALEYMGKEVKTMHPKANKDGIAAHLTFVSRVYRLQAKKLKAS